MYKNADVADWYKKHGRHPIYAGSRPMPVPDQGFDVKLPASLELPAYRQ
jgi:hypothetical protein